MNEIMYNQEPIKTNEVQPKPLQKICDCGRFMAIKWEFDWYRVCKCGNRIYNS